MRTAYCALLNSPLTGLNNFKKSRGALWKRVPPLARAADGLLRPQPLAGPILYRVYLLQNHSLESADRISLVEAAGGRRGILLKREGPVSRTRLPPGGIHR